jgi:hypothetical protein
MSKLINLSVDELYDRPKKTPAVISAIVSKTDFSKIQPKYCEEICKLQCKEFKTIGLNTAPVDILIIQDHKNPPGKFDRREGQQDDIQEAVIGFLCQEAGFRWEGLKVRLHSLLKCSATSKDFPNGKPPTQTTLQKCFPYLDAEIKASKPKVIISLGTAVTKSLGLTHYSNSGNRGQVILSEYGPVVLTLHPKVLTYIRQNARGGGGMWGPDYFNVVKRDFIKAADLATGRVKYTKSTLEETVELIKKDRLRVAKSLDDVIKFVAEINALPENKIISFDTETTSLDPADPDLRILTIQFGWINSQGQSVAVVIPLWHRKNDAYSPDEAWNVVAPLLTGSRAKVGHNSKYDILVIFWATGVRVANVLFDTLLIQHSIESGTQGCYGLKTACWDHLFHLGIAGYEDDLGSLSDLEPEELEEAEESGE